MRAPEIDSYRFGHMVVDGEEYTNDLILLPGRVISNWWRAQGHRLSVADLDEVFDTQPEVLVVGTGASGVMDVPQETRQAIRDAGIELEVARTGEAWKRYNDLQDERAAAGAFHLTC
jgi:hypothetical protein